MNLATLISYQVEGSFACVCVHGGFWGDSGSVMVEAVGQHNAEALRTQVILFSQVGQDNAEALRNQEMLEETKLFLSDAVLEKTTQQV